MAKRNPPGGRTSRIIYWIFTIWLALGMVSTGIVQLMKMRTGAGALDSVAHLGYPAYLLTILGVWKILGVIALLIPRFPILKEWVYAGLFFTMTGAIYSHVVMGDTMKEIFPAVLMLALAAISWYSRPVGRKPILANFSE